MLVNIPNDTDIIDYFNKYGVSHSDGKMTGELINFTDESKYHFDIDDKYFHMLKGYEEFSNESAELGIYLNNNVNDQYLEYLEVAGFKLTEHNVLVIDKFTNSNYNSLEYIRDMYPNTVFNLKLTDLLDRWPKIKYHKEIMDIERLHEVTVVPRFDYDEDDKMFHMELPLPITNTPIVTGYVQVMYTDTYPADGTYMVLIGNCPMLKTQIKPTLNSIKNLINDIKGKYIC